MKYEIVKLRECPERKDEAAVWFHEKWGYPLEAYRESMEECLAGGGPVPQWYMAVAEGRIIGGLGVIENDYHDRKDLTPNVWKRRIDVRVSRGHYWIMSARIWDSWVFLPSIC